MIRINLLGQARPKTTKQSRAARGYAADHSGRRGIGHRARGSFRHLLFAEA